MTKVIIDIDPKGILDNIGLAKGGKAQRFLNNEIIRVTDPFVPFRKGFLKNSAKEEADGRSISYNMVYASRLYHNPQFRFVGSPIRGGKWVERSWAINGDEVLKGIEKGLVKGVFR
jgi:hypothetical protein